MGLLKGSNLRFTTSEAIVGADVILPTEGSSPTGEVVSTVPLENPENVSETVSWEIDEDVDDLFSAEVIVDEEEQGDSEFWQAPVTAFEKVREQVLHGGVEASDMEANEQGEQIQQAAAPLMEKSLRQAEDELLSATPDADFSTVAPFVQRKVAAVVDLELIGTVNEVRWTHLQRVEKQVVDGAEDIANGLVADFPEGAFIELMSRRESILSAARLEAERLVLEAMTQSAETMSQAEQARAAAMQELEADRTAILDGLRQQAYQEGYQEGKSAGEAEAAQYISDAIHKFNEMVMAFPAAVKQNEEKLVTLALEIARKVIHEEISLQPEIVQSTVEAALKRVSDLEQVVVKVNPLDLDLILPKQESFKALVPDVQNFSIEGSHTIQRGGCVIETNSGSINATIQAQLGIVDEMFKKVRAEYEDELLGEIN
ncbi:MAG: FliH/SctL family protein [Candidatus Sericytochromatia bacterium]|nr:FliH/SctL family protein [Candidatus Sericytochromatia bacterium]